MNNALEIGSLPPKPLHIPSLQKGNGRLKVTAPLHKIDLEISKFLKNTQGLSNTVGDIARKINAPCSNVEWHLRQCIAGLILQKPRKGPIEDTKVTKACEILSRALNKVPEQTGGPKK